MSLWRFQAAIAGWLKAHAAKPNATPSDDDYERALLEDARAELARRAA